MVKKSGVRATSGTSTRHAALKLGRLKKPRQGHAFTSRVLFFLSSFLYSILGTLVETLFLGQVFISVHQKEAQHEVQDRNNSFLIAGFRLRLGFGGRLA